jgi:hypothetical protein
MALRAPVPAVTAKGKVVLFEPARRVARGAFASVTAAGGGVVVHPARRADLAWFYKLQWCDGDQGELVRLLLAREHGRQQRLRI